MAVKGKTFTKTLMSLSSLILLPPNHAHQDTSTSPSVHFWVRSPKPIKSCKVSPNLQWLAPVPGFWAVNLEHFYRGRVPISISDLYGGLYWSPPNERLYILGVLIQHAAMLMLLTAQTDPKQVNEVIGWAFPALKT